MIFSLKSASDLGRCSYCTLKNVFDTEKDIIYDNDVKVEITKIEDLFPYLWQSPGMGGHSGDKSFAYFYGANTHWHKDFDESIIDSEKNIKKLQAKLNKDPKNKCANKWQQQLTDLIDHKNHLINMLKNLDTEMAEQQLKLIEENKR